MNIRRSFVSFHRLFLLLGIFVLFFYFAPAVHVRADSCTTDITGKSKAELAVELDACNAEITKWTNILNNARKDSASYANDVAYLTAKINAAQANIKAKNIAIANLGKNIIEKEAKITALDNKIEDGRSSLGELIRKTKEIDNYSLAEAMLSNKNLSDFFSDVDAYSATERSMAVIFAELRGNKAQTQTEKDALNKQREAEANAKAQIELAKKQVEVSQAEKKTLLAESKSKEVSYGKVLADRQAKAAQIRAILFNLRDTGAIPFGTALQYAQEAGLKTGVRPAFLLAILTQESNLGSNVGSCYLTDLSTGDGKGANSGDPKSRVMNPSRDVPVFVDILRNIGGDPYSTKVSCWQPIYNSSRQPIGWGGAMGPAQFIPSTWKLFATRISGATGSAYANPWNARDAFFASAIYLSDLGALSGSYSGEKNAACKYYSGSSCKTSYANTYGTSVMNKAATIQTTMIDPLQGI